MGCGADWSGDGFGSGYGSTVASGGWASGGGVQGVLISLFIGYSQFLYFTSWNWSADISAAVGK